MRKALTVILGAMFIVSVILVSCGTTCASADSSKPDLHGAVYELDARNEVVRWVQNQLKATGVYYQGSEWKVTGHLGKGTMKEIKRFMEDRGYPGHSGAITQQVVDELYAFLHPSPNPDPVPTDNGRIWDNRIYYDYSVPLIRNTVYELDARSDDIRWVQNQLKATGVYYQGAEWKVTGHLGKGTMREVKRFMEDRGFYGHSGIITQQVIDELYAYLHNGQYPYYYADDDAD